MKLRSGELVDIAEIPRGAIDLMTGGNVCRFFT